MQEKAWSTGGLKKLIHKFTGLLFNKETNTTEVDGNLYIVGALDGDEIYDQYVSKTPEISIRQYGTDYLIAEDIKVTEIYIINHTKKWIFNININYINNQYVGRGLDYNSLMSNYIINVKETNPDISSGTINNGSIDIELPNVGNYLYNEGDSIEMIFKTSKYGYPIEI